jgi:hypothetical protein
MSSWLSLYLFLPFRPLKLPTSIHNNRKEVKTEFLNYKLHYTHRYEIQLHIDIYCHHCPTSPHRRWCVLYQQILKVYLDVVRVGLRFVTIFLTKFRTVLD